MKKLNFVLILALSMGFQYAHAQEQDLKKVNSARIFKISDASVIEGYLYQLKDSTISLSSSPLLSSPTITFHEINVQDIQKIEIQKKRQMGKRMLIGALSGFAIGGIIGFATGGSSEGLISFSRGESALMSGIIFGIGGGLIYGIGGSKKTVKINGSKETYYKKHRTLKEYLLIK